MPFSPGQTIGRYKILAKLGEGGMGEVYEARDETLGRSVALKVLTAESAQRASRLDRFRTEAKAIAALNHPNIVHIYSVEESDGVHFLTMEKVEGEPLDQRTPEGGMEIEAFFVMATPLAAAVTAAHSAGVTHRDLKPANILLDSEGRPKVLDFGLAKMEPRASDVDIEAERTVMMTREGAVIGSAPYMSPEQARGEAIDARSDIFSLGTVLYQALTGVSPFRRRSTVESQMAVIHDRPKALLELRPDLPPSVAAIIDKAMAKEPDSRYRSAAELHRDLKTLDREMRLADSTDTAGSQAGQRRGKTLRERLIPARPWLLRRWAWPAAISALAVLGWMGRGWLHAPTPVVGQQSLAVLPFDNLTGSPASDYLGTGIAVHLITRLSELSDLRVVGRSEAWDEGEQERSRQELARRLGVDMFLEGGVQRDDDNLRVSLQLTDAKRNTTVWGETFIEAEDRLMDLQSEIAEWVTGVLQVSVSRGERRRLNQDPTRSFRAYDLYLQGQEFLSNRQLRRGPELASQVFRQATHLDPEFALAHVGLSEALWYRFRNGEGVQFLDQAEKQAQAAVALDPELAAAQVARARILRERGEVGRSIAELQRAVANHPKPAEAYIELGYSYRRVGELEAAEESFRAATVLDAEDWRNWNQLGVILTDQGRLDEAEESFEQARRVGPEDNVWPLSNLVAIRVLQSEFEAAIATIDSSPEEITDADLAANLATAYYYTNRYRQAEPLYRRAIQLDSNNATHRGNLGDLLAALGRTEEATETYLLAIPLAEKKAEATGAPSDRLLSALYNAKAARCQPALAAAVEVEPMRAQDGYIRALTLALCGSKEQAIEAVETAIRLGHPAEMISADREFMHLRGIDTFDRLTSLR